VVFWGSAALPAMLSGGGIQRRNQPLLVIGQAPNALDGASDIDRKKRTPQLRLPVHANGIKLILDQRISVQSLRLALAAYPA